MAAPQSVSRRGLTAAPQPATVGAPGPATLAARGWATAGALAALLRPAASGWLLAVLLGASATGFGLALSAVSGWLIVRASEQPAIMYLLVAIVGVRFFGLGRAVVRYAERLASHAAVFASIDALRLRLWRALAARGAAMRRLLDGGSAVSMLITRLEEIRDNAPRVVTPLVAGALATAGVALVTGLVAAPVALPVAAGLALLAVVAPLAAVLSDREPDPDALPGLARDAAALASAGPELRANGVADRALELVARRSGRLARRDRRRARAEGLGAAIVVAGTGMLAAAVPVLDAAGALPAASLAVVALLLLGSAEPLLGIAGAARRASALRAGLRAVAPLLAPHPAAAAGSAGVPTPAGSLELRSLAARWPAEETRVFEHVDADVAAGQWLAITGPSGSGKSTLLAVLTAGLAPDTGTVALGGVEVRSADAVSWRRRVAWCPQEAHVFDSTVRGNLRLARGGADAPDDAELRSVLERVGLGPLLAQLEEGLDARVGAGGRSLSGGERQRLAVARALLARADVLLLDEPTAHLDDESAGALLADLRRASGDRIVVLVTHRVRDIRPEDAVVILGAPGRTAREPGLATVSAAPVPVR